jgi:hypothetical protein
VADRREEFTTRLERVDALLQDWVLVHYARELIDQPAYTGMELPSLMLGEAYPVLVKAPIDSKDRLKFIADVYTGSADRLRRARAAVTEVSDALLPLMGLDSDLLVESHGLLAEAWDGGGKGPRTIPEDFALLKNHHEDWNGEAADNFFDRFYSPLYEVRAHHGEVFHEFGRLLGAVRVANDRIQADVLNWLNAEVVTIERGLGSKSGSSDWGSPMKYLGTALSVVAAVGGPAMGAFAAVGAIASFIGDLEPKTVAGEAHPAPDFVISSLPDLAAGLRTEFYNAVGWIDDEVRKALAVVDGWHNHRVFSIPRPMVSGGADGPGFHHQSADESYN